jgi:SAM-dependent methyltransferase
MDPYRRFYELAGRRYPEDELTYSSLSGATRRKWVLAAMRRFLSPGNLLDCGSNIGRLSQAWRRGPVFGVDLARHALSRRLFPHVNFIHADLRAFSFIRDGSIANAIVIETLEHLPEPQPFLRDLHRAMRPDGRVLITTPGYAKVRPRTLSLGLLRSYGIDEAQSGAEYYHTAYKPDELSALVQGAGFEVMARGGFEHELRGWVKPLVLLAGLYGRCADRLCPRSRLNILVLGALRALEMNIFQLLETFGFSGLLRRLFPEGRRSYVVCRR